MSFYIKFPKHFFTNFITTTGEHETQIKILDVNVTYILFMDKKIVNIRNYYNAGFIFCYLSKYYCFYIKHIYTKSCFLFIYLFFLWYYYCYCNIQKQPPEVFYKKGVLRNFTKFTGKHLCQSLFFSKVASLACNLTKKETLTQVFFCEFCDISKNTAGRLLL